MCLNGLDWERARVLLLPNLSALQCQHFKCRHLRSLWEAQPVVLGPAGLHRASLFLGMQIHPAYHCQLEKSTLCFINFVLFSTIRLIEVNITSRALVGSGTIVHQQGVGLHPSSAQEVHNQSSFPFTLLFPSP